MLLVALIAFGTGAAVLAATDTAGPGRTAQHVEANDGYGWGGVPTSP
jgi:hypothetical protein